jgi:uncharacterized membrane protein (UPF0127 family)
MPPRLRRLPRAALPEPLARLDVRRARTRRARLLGLAGLRELPPGSGLLLPRTRSIHTFGMRFALDLLWLDADGRVVRVDRDVPPGRVRGCRAAHGVVELPAAARRATMPPVGPYSTG